jgi:cell division protein FtsA
MGVPVRRGVPAGSAASSTSSSSPVYATGVGLVVYGAKQMAGPQHVPHSRRERVQEGGRRMGQWLQEVF